MDLQFIYFYITPSNKIKELEMDFWPFSNVDFLKDAILEWFYQCKREKDGFSEIYLAVRSTTVSWNV